MKRRFKYSFAKKKETEGGFASMIFAGLTLLLFLITLVYSFIMKGKAPSWVGAFGIMAMLLSGNGFFVGISSFKEKEKSYWYSVVGSMANGIFFIGWLALFLIGI